MTPGKLEGIPVPISNAFSNLEVRIMQDIVRRIKINGFSTASADWQMTRLVQLGESEEAVKEWIQDALDVSDKELDRIYSDELYKEYMGHGRAYKVSGMEQIPFEENLELQEMIRAIKAQTNEEFRNITATMGFVKKDPGKKGLGEISLTEYYRKTLDEAMLDIHSGAFDYQTVLMRTINEMTQSGIRWIDYGSGVHSRVDVAARRAVMTGFRQVQGKVNEQVAAQLHTDSYEVTYHIGARPTHQPWQGRVYTMGQLKSICGLGQVDGLHGANCYHDYNAFVPGVSVRTYTDKQLDAMLKEENTPKTYHGKEYTAYEALQQQRKMERTMRKYRQDINLLKEGGGSDEALILKRARYQGKRQEYAAFSEAMGLPEQGDRIYQDGLKGRFTLTKKEEKYLENKRRIAIIKEKLKKAGIRGNPVYPAKVLDITEFGFDDAHINRERKHGVSKKEAQQLIKEADIVLERWDGKFQNYYGKNGAVYVDIQNKSVKTAFTADEYDGRVREILEAIKKDGAD